MDTVTTISPGDRFAIFSAVYEVRTVAQDSVVLFPAENARLSVKHLAVRTLLANGQRLGPALKAVG